MIDTILTGFVTCIALWLLVTLGFYLKLGPVEMELDYRGNQTPVDGQKYVNTRRIGHGVYTTLYTVSIVLGIFGGVYLVGLAVQHLISMM